MGLGNGVDNENLCAIEHHLQVQRFLPLAGLESGTRNNQLWISQGESSSQATDVSIEIFWFQKNLRFQ